MLRKVSSSFKIGRLKLNNRLIQAPLAGISCAPFRELFSKFTQPAYALTEMISANSIVYNKKLANRYLYRSAQEGLLGIQLSGNTPDILVKAIKICEKYNPDLIDLNCGCPKLKIRSKGCGSALMENLANLADIISAMRAATSLPLTVKIRVAGNTGDDRYLEAASIIEQCGADAIIVHGRHHSEDYTCSANYEQIKKVAMQVKIPVIANGDVHDIQSLQDCLAKTSACAFMIGRASIGRPWIFQQLLGHDVNLTSIDILQIFKEHVNNLVDLEGCEYKALTQSRRLIKWYFPVLSQELLLKCYSIVNLNDLFSFISSLFEKALIKY